jgi:tetratricopeptide (TPR) repeat protein
MGRQERPLPRSGGALEAFASDLRVVRRAAGNPSYRALARRAGYSASSLASAASGRAVPSLAVTLAYVGACGADSVPWEGRWEKLQVTLAAQGRATGPVTPPAAPVAVPSGAAPRELPPDVYGFTGRDAELAALDAVPAADVPVAAVCGTGGVGKTALVVRWAHRVAERFPDGQLYADLRGYDRERPVQPADALAGFLRALGVGSDELPPDGEERAALYRSLLAGRRVLVVLDNAHSAAQVGALLPGTPCVVTSRDSLADLDARHIDLDLLPAAQAVALLRRLVGARVDAEPAAAAELAQRCARLPLALRIAAERAVAHAGAPLADLVAELAGHPGLSLFEAGADERTAVRAVFSWSYRYLPPDTARVFRLLGLHPGPDIDRYAVAALAGGDVDGTWQAVEALQRAHLVTVTAGRVGMHDLLRQYAAEHAAADDETQRSAALGRLLDHYVIAASAAMDTLFPHERHRRPDPPVRPELPVPDLSAPAAARAWLDAERANLVALTAWTAEHGWPRYTGRLAGVVWRYLYAGAYHVEALTIHAHALRVAREQGDRAGEAAAIHNTGRVYWRWGRHDEAREHFERALAIYQEIGAPSQVGLVLNNLGNLFDLHGHFDEAVDRYKEALAILGDCGDLAGEASTLGNLGIVYEVMGRQTESIEHHQQALAMFRNVGDRGGVGRTLDNLGSVFFRQGRYTEALHHHEQALAILDELGDRASAAETLNGLGRVHLRLGHATEALDYFGQALDLAERIDDRVRQTSALVGLGDTLRRTGHPGQALARYHSALELSDQTGDRYERGHALAGTGHVLRDNGHTEPARRYWSEALNIYTELDIAEADGIRAALASLPPP